MNTIANLLLQIRGISSNDIISLYPIYFSSPSSFKAITSISLTIAVSSFERSLQQRKKTMSLLLDGSLHGVQVYISCMSCLPYSRWQAESFI